jgi:hypothetical protein
MGRIDNPLRYIDDLPAYVTSFYDSRGLERILRKAVLMRGAELARDEDIFRVEDQEFLSNHQEQIALQEEEHRGLRYMTKELRVILLTCCVSAVVQYVLNVQHSNSMTDWLYLEDGSRQAS